MPVPAAIAIPAAIQGAIGLAQGVKGFVDASNNERPKYEIPPEVFEALNSVKRQAGQKYMPGEQVGRQLEQENMAGIIDQLMATGMSAGDLSQSLTGVHSQTMKNEAGRTVQRAKYLDGLQEQVRRYLKDVASYRDVVYRENELNPFLDKASQASAMIGAGGQNVMGAINTAAMGAMVAEGNQNDTGASNTSARGAMFAEGGGDVPELGLLDVLGISYTDLID